MWNNATEKHEFYRELMDGQWYVDTEGFLYIVPVPEALMDIEGPDSDVLDSLYRACRENNGRVPDEVADELGLTTIPSHLRRFNEVDGYYHA